MTIHDALELGVIATSANNTYFFQRGKEFFTNDGIILKI